MASRLFVEVRERRGLTYGIDAGETAYSDAGLWSVDWQCAPDRLADILHLVRAHPARRRRVRRHRGASWPRQGSDAWPDVLSYEGPSSRMSRLGVNDA